MSQAKNNMAHLLKLSTSSTHSDKNLPKLPCFAAAAMKRYIHCCLLRLSAFQGRSLLPQHGSPAPQLARRGRGYHFCTRRRKDSAAQLLPIRGASPRCVLAQPQLSISAVQMVGSNLKLVPLRLLETTSSPPDTEPFPASTPSKCRQHNFDSVGDKEEMRLWEPPVWLHLDFLPCGSAPVLEDADCKHL